MAMDLGWLVVTSMAIDKACCKKPAGDHEVTPWAAKTGQMASAGDPVATRGSAWSLLKV